MRFPARDGEFEPPWQNEILRLPCAGDRPALRHELPAVSQHLKVLERAGLIARGRDGQKRPCRLNAERLAETARWFDHTRAAWDARFDRLESFLEQP